MALSACGPEEIASPGTGGNVTINNNTTNPPAPTPTPTPTSSLVTPATGCPTITAAGGLADEGTITGPTGTWRVCALPLVIDESSNLPYIPGLLYRLAGQTAIGTDQGAASTGNDVTLSIEPGVIVYASGSSYLAATRGNRLNAVGTEDRPIIFTSRDNVLGLNGENSSSQWGGVVLLGRAPVVDCVAAGATPGSAACEFALEGSATPAFGGGTNSADNSGRLEFVQIRFSGFILGNDNELQGLTTVGSGSGTIINNLQSVNSSDDGVEFFGGSVNMKRLIVYGAEDDSLDVDVGVKGQFQHVILSQRAVGDALVEGDSSNGREDQLPRTDVVIANATMIKRTPGSAGLRIRGGMDFTVVNSVILDLSSNSQCLRIDDAQTMREANVGLQDDGPPVFASNGFQCPTLTRNGSIGNDPGPTAAQALALITGNGNNTAYTNTLVSGYLNGPNETAFTPIFDVTALSSFFSVTTYIGAVSPDDDWTQGWTCNMQLLNFGTGNTGSCLTLPVYPATA
nr:hypothetical protein [Altererythrobacter sp. KTW20L]